MWDRVILALRMNVLRTVSGTGWGRPSRGRRGEGYDPRHQFDLRRTVSTRTRELVPP